MISRHAIDYWFEMMCGFIQRKLNDGVKIEIIDGAINDLDGEVYGFTQTNCNCPVVISKQSNRVATLIHEFLHKMFPDQEEDFIQNLEKELIVTFTTEQQDMLNKFLDI